MIQIMQIIAAVIAIGWIGVMIWSWFRPSPPPTTPSSEDAERDRAIGFMVGMLGGSIEAAAQVRYTISRLEEELGRKATIHEIATAVGVKLGSGF